MGSLEVAVVKLRSLYRGLQSGSIELALPLESLGARQEVYERYDPLFHPDAIDHLTEVEFRDFLLFKNNRHWIGLHRVGPAVCADMNRLREALKILLDESREIDERLNQLVPSSGPNYVPRLGKAVLTAILLISFPERYGVWNRISESAMKSLKIWPDFKRGLAFGERYALVNSVILEVAHELGVDLWTLDSLWWCFEQQGNDPPLLDLETTEENTEEICSEASFGLEKHLQEFLRDNWAQTELGAEWQLYEEDGDPDAGCEYPCSVGRIDLLAQHLSEPRWLVIELKRAQTSDPTVGQVLRYMGWVRRNLADDGDDVEGLVIAHTADERLEYAIREVPKVRLKLYEVSFRLREVEE